MGQKLSLPLCIILLTLICGCSGVRKAEGLSTINPYNYFIQKNSSTYKGAVVSAHPLASEVGLLMLKKGGNAIDAAIATQLALAVVYPAAGNLGGGGFMVARMNKGKTLAIDFREKAPLKATHDMYLDEAGNPVMQQSQIGHLASGVPGTVAGIFAALPHGKLPLQTLINPAIELAQKGFAITQEEATGLNAHKSRFIKYSTQPSALVKEKQWQVGDTLIQPQLASTLIRIRDFGKAGFYEGETAKLIVEEMARGKGIITLEDLKTYEAQFREAMIFPYREYSIITMPLPSSGGVCLPQLMHMVAKQPLASYGFHSKEAVQLMVEAERRAYADRAAYLGDPDFYKVPVTQLTSPEYAQQRIADYEPGKAGKSTQIREGQIIESEETTHLSVVDKFGNAVALTTTLNGGYGSHTVVGGAGFLLNNEMDDFSVKPGVPNMYGATGAEANAIKPGKRMLSSMTPTIVLRNNMPYLVTGTPGGTTIITSVFQTLVNVLDFGLSVKDAVNMPKFHHQWLPDVVYIEKDFPAAVADSLKSMGYSIVPRSSIGRTELIRILPDGTIEAAADTRGSDHVAAY